MLSIIPTLSLLLNFCVLNAQSLRNKVSDLNDLITERKLDILVVTESWLKPSDPEYYHKVSELCPDGYSYISEPRPKKSGGGISIVHKSSLCVKTIKPVRKPKYFECLPVVVDSTFLLLAIYRTPPKNLRERFLDELDDFMSQLITGYSSILVCGDINLHFENPGDLFAKRFMALSSDFGLTDHIAGRPTHKYGGSLDVLLSKSISCFYTEVNDLQISDHYPIFSVLGIPSSQNSSKQEKAPPRYYKFRDYRLLDCDEFYSHLTGKIGQLSHSCSEGNDSDILASRLDQLLRSSVDQFAPEMTRKTSQKVSESYRFDPIVAEAKSKRRQLERQYRKSGLEIHKQLYKEQRLLVRKLAHQSKARYFQTKISSCTTTKQLFDTVNRLTTDVSNKLPSSDDDTALCNRFSQFFSDKIEKITAQFPSYSRTIDFSYHPPGIVMFDQFQELSTHEIAKLRPIKCSPLDHVSNNVFTKLWGVMLPIISQIVNLSLSTGCFLSVYKEAQIKPLIKSNTLDPELLNSYRPVSNLSYISKVIETAMNNQILDHFSSNNLLSAFQSAYRRGHGVESTITHVYSSILKQLDKGHHVFLILLDLSAAFDTISHSQLLLKLQSNFNITGPALKLIQSYLTGRTTKVRIHSSLSSSMPCGVGVPQGSVLGPVLFNCVMRELPSLLEAEGVDCHLYADDTQFWVSFPPSQESCARVKVQRCFQVIKDFMSSNCLKLNSNKTQFLPISKTLMHTDFAPLALDQDTLIEPSSDVRNLGVNFDCNLNFKKQISLLRQSCFFQLKRVKSIQSYLPSGSLETLIHAFVTSRLDFCNIIYNGLPHYCVSAVQSIQNSCAKAITRARKYDSATEQLFTLHWLPVKRRAEYKGLIICHKIAHGVEFTPQYFNDVIGVHKPVRFTRSSEAILLRSDFRAQFVYAGERSIDHFLPKLWNSLPLDLRNESNFTAFKRKLKTYLFQQHFYR